MSPGLSPCNPNAPQLNLALARQIKGIMSGNHTDTRDNQLKILEKNGYRRIGNTSIFKNGYQILISPSVSINSNGKYWFDVRQAIIDREIAINSCLIRIVPDRLILIKMIELNEILTTPYKKDADGNMTWGFEINFKNQVIINKKNKSISLKINVVNELSIGDF